MKIILANLMLSLFFYVEKVVSTVGYLHVGGNCSLIHRSVE